mmetsp:Transcript_19037/g.44425  ORF Transcript_19037/g.44425 Transcript_19037/m.44425 type:complete len:247 (+) Transcript_19037:60-800(+)
MQCVNVRRAREWARKQARDADKARIYALELEVHHLHEQLQSWWSWWRTHEQNGPLHAAESLRLSHTDIDASEIAVLPLQDVRQTPAAAHEDAPEDPPKDGAAALPNQQSDVSRADPRVPFQDGHGMLRDAICQVVGALDVPDGISEAAWVDSATALIQDAVMELPELPQLQQMQSSDVQALFGDVLSRDSAATLVLTEFHELLPMVARECDSRLDSVRLHLCNALASQVQQRLHTVCSVVCLDDMG